MRLVLISDTHEQHFNMKIPDGDVLIHAGDATYRGQQRALQKFGKWMREQPHAHKIFIGGNHDLLLEQNPVLAPDFFRGIHYLCETSVEIHGVKFWGSPFSPRFMDWAFQCERGDDCERRWAKIPEGTDVVITHGPPRGCGDECPAMEDRTKLVHVGCKQLLARLDAIKPKLAVCGHIHEGYGTYYTPGGTPVVNASSVDGNYRCINPPVVVDIE